MLDSWSTRLPDEGTILRSRHLLEKHKLAAQVLALINDMLRDKGLMLRANTVVDAALNVAPSSTKNAEGERDPEMHQTKKGNQWHFGMKAYIGADAESGQCTVIGTAANVNVNDVTQANSLLHGQETDAFGDAGYQGAYKRADAEPVSWHVAMRPGKRRRLDENMLAERLIDEVERLKASSRAKVEHPFRAVKRQFGLVKVRYRRLKKNTAQLTTLFALGNLWMARGRSL